MTEPTSPLDACVYLYGQPQCRGILKATPEDFVVEEDLGFEPEGEGEHVWLWIEKRLSNTEQVARAIARLAGVKAMDVGYAGMKDRVAVTRQWFSIYLSNKEEPDWQQLNSENVNVLSVTRGKRKLRRGALKGNRFSIRITSIEGESGELSPRIEKIINYGVPNYFGAQRFGRDNLARATHMFASGKKMRDRHKRGLYLSAVRSEIFNRVLSKRVEAECWNTAMPGDVMMLDGSHSVFAIEAVDADIERRLSEKDIHVSGPLWGRGEPQVSEEALRFESQITDQATDWCEGLEKAGMKQERRSLRLLAKEIEWDLKDSALHVTFWLPSGSYATMLLRELIDVSSPS